MWQVIFWVFMIAFWLLIVIDILIDDDANNVKSGE